MGLWAEGLPSATYASKEGAGIEGGEAQGLRKV